MSTNMKNVIAAAFFTMVEERGIDRITVKDLVETCHISRQTFYYHFQDLVDVIEWSAGQAVRKALEVSLAEEEPEQAIRAFIAAGVENHALIQKLLQSQKHEHIERIFVEGLKAHLMEMFRQKAPDLTVSLEDTEVALGFYAFGIAGVLLEQCSRPDCDPDKLAGQLLKLLQGKLIPVENKRV